MRALNRPTGKLQQEFSNSSRPASRPSRNPSVRITLRLSKEEDAKLRKLCEGTTVSAYVRERLFEPEKARRKRRSHVPVRDQEVLAQILGLLGQSRIANNLNQLAYHANTGTLLLDEETIGQISEGYRHIVAMRAALIKVSIGVEHCAPDSSSHAGFFFSNLKKKVVVVEAVVMWVTR